MITIRYYQPCKIVTLYNFKQNKQFKGMLYITYPNQEVKAALLPKIFLWLAFLGFATTIFPPVYSEINYRLTTLAQNAKVVQQIPALAEIPINDEFFLEIPKINLTSTIIPNVDSANESVYLEKLKEGVGHARDSYFPGDSGPIVLFSHSTDTLARIIQYNAKFYGLKDLEIGNEIIIRFKGTIYTYRVTEKKIINPDELDTIRQTSAKLILTTCWPPGTDWQRIVVFAS